MCRVLDVDEEAESTSYAVGTGGDPDLEVVGHLAIDGDDELLRRVSAAVVDTTDLGEGPVRFDHPGHEGHVEGTVEARLGCYTHRKWSVPIQGQGIPDRVLQRPAGRHRLVRSDRRGGRIDIAIDERHRLDRSRAFERPVLRGTDIGRGKQRQGHGHQDDRHHSDDMRSALEDRRRVRRSVPQGPRQPIKGG